VVIEDRRDTRHWSGSAAIVGVGYRVSRETEKPPTPLRLILEACVDALRDAGVEREKVQALFATRAPVADQHPQFNVKIGTELGLTTRFSTEVTQHAAGTIASLKYAMLAVNSGIVDYALCCGGDTSNLWIQGTRRVGATAFHDSDPQFETPYGPSMIGIYAQHAIRYMHEYGATEEHFARVAVEHRRWAVAHPQAVMRSKGLITVKDVLASPMIAYPIRLFECSPRLPQGSAGALLVTRAEIAREICERPIYILGVGECSTNEYASDRLSLLGTRSFERPTYTESGLTLAATDAYDMAGLGPKDLDVVQCVSNFSSIFLTVIEDLGLCARGEAAAFVETGGIDFESGLPVNTNGGHLGFGHPGPSMNMDSLVEGVRQLQRRAVGKQVEGARVCLVHGTGAPLLGCNAVAILGTERPN